MFLAPIGAQVMLTFVRAFVRSGQICLKQSIFIFLGQKIQRVFRENSLVYRDYLESAQRALKEQSESYSWSLQVSC